jgi:hypothetical protein
MEEQGCCGMKAKSSRDRPPVHRWKKGAEEKAYLKEDDDQPAALVKKRVAIEAKQGFPGLE